jgi:hypothetical protein
VVEVCERQVQELRNNVGRGFAMSILLKCPVPLIRPLVLHADELVNGKLLYALMAGDRQRRQSTSKGA